MISMVDPENASFLWVCITQAICVVLAAGTVVGLMLNERNGYEPRHRLDRGSLSTWQSHGRAFRGYLTVLDPDDLDQRRAAVDAAASAIEARVEVWNRELLSGPLFDLPPAGPDAPERYEPSAGDPAYLELSPGALDRSAREPLRPHAARVATSELPLVELDKLVGVP